MASLSATGRTSAKDRILAVAAGLFAKHGFNGISTRDIAASAGVREVTVYRHYPTKRDLYRAVLESELSKIHLRGDALAHIAAAPDISSVVNRIYGLIATMLGQSPELIRLIQFTSLEVSGDFEPLLREYLAQPIDVLAGYLKPWIGKGALGNAEPRSLLMIMIAIVFSRPMVETILREDAPTPDTMLTAYAEFLRHEQPPPASD